jgi:hypothetical protein
MADEILAEADDAQRADDKTIVSWRPRSVPQAAYVTCPVFEIFYGGSRGSLKTEGTIGDWIQHSNAWREDATGIMLRRTRVQLAETFERAKRVLGPLGFHPSGHTITSPQGARLRFAYLEKDSDAENYQGDNNTRIYIEEIGNFPNPAPVMKMMATLRSTKGVHVGFRATGNPGGPGHGWVKARYVAPQPQGWKVHRRAIRQSMDGRDGDEAAHLHPWAASQITTCSGRTTSPACKCRARRRWCARG